jgi:hypothetical protein
VYNAGEVAGDDAHPARHPVKDLEELNGLLGAWLRTVYNTGQKLAIAIFEWIEAWYSPARRHSALGWDSPVTHESAPHADHWGHDHHNSPGREPEARSMARPRQFCITEEWCLAK